MNMAMRWFFSLGVLSAALSLGIALKVKVPALTTVTTTPYLRASHWRSISLPSVETRLYSAATISSDQSSPRPPQAPISSVAKASLLISSINLLKNCVGAGVFSLSSRVTAITSSTVPPIPFKYVVTLIFGMAVWAVYNFFILGETCRITEKNTFGEAWNTCVSASSQWIVQFVITMAPIVSCIANTIVLTDVLKLLMRVLGLPAMVYGTRPLVVAILAAFILYPVCIVEDLTALKSVSTVGLLGQFTAMAAMGIRILDGSYRAGGQFYATMQTAAPAAKVIGNAAVCSKPVAAAAVTAAAGGAVMASLSKWFVLASLLSYCYVTHYNVRIYLYTIYIQYTYTIHPSTRVWPL